MGKVYALKGINRLKIDRVKNRELFEIKRVKNKMVLATNFH
ncbi:MAG: hypothetical protein AB1422_17505 [bacterium]